MLRIVSLLFLSLACGTAFTVNAQSSGRLRECAGRDHPAAPGLQCFESKYGWFLTDDTAWASQAIPAMEKAADQFDKFFGKSVGQGVVIHHRGDDANTDTGQSDDPALPPPARWSWHWLVVPQLGDLESGMNAHEMGHTWLRQNFAWGPQKEGEYGTAAADWLDESAAILAEDSLHVEIRRNGLMEMYRAGNVLPLGTFFTARHDDVKGFYEICRGVIDFLIERSGDSTIFGAIATNEAGGSNVTQWLRTNGARYHLPTTMNVLETEWQDWLSKLK